MMIARGFLRRAQGARAHRRFSVFPFEGRARPPEGPASRRPGLAPGRAAGPSSSSRGPRRENVPECWPLVMVSTNEHY